LKKNTGIAPDVDTETSIKIYRGYYSCVKQGLILSGHDISEGGLAVTLSEICFSGNTGLEIDLKDIPADDDTVSSAILFSETAGRLVFEIKDKSKVSEIFKGLPFSIIGRTSSKHDKLIIKEKNNILIDKKIKNLRAQWQKTLQQLY